jgi:hypothetical protein
MDVGVVFICCQYCKKEFKRKNELHFHWFKECRESQCRCSNCLCPIRVEKQATVDFKIYFNRTNLFVGVREIMKKHFPDVDMPPLPMDECAEPQIKRVRFNCDPVPMEEQ